MNNRLPTDVGLHFHPTPKGVGFQFRYLVMENKVPSDILDYRREVLSRRDYQEILLARLAGGG